MWYPGGSGGGKRPTPPPPPFLIPASVVLPFPPLTRSRCVSASHRPPLAHAAFSTLISTAVALAPMPWPHGGLVAWSGAATLRQAPMAFSNADAADRSAGKKCGGVVPVWRPTRRSARQQWRGGWASRAPLPWVGVGCGCVCVEGVGVPGACGLPVSASASRDDCCLFFFRWALSLSYTLCAPAPLLSARTHTRPRQASELATVCGGRARRREGWACARGVSKRKKDVGGGGDARGWGWGG